MVGVTNENMLQRLKWKVFESQPCKSEKTRAFILNTEGGADMRESESVLCVLRTHIPKDISNISF